MSRFVLSIIILFFYGVAMASDRYINIVTPDGNSMIDPAAPVTVSGTGKGLFEGNVVIRFEDLDGKLLVQEPTTMQSQDIAAAGEWQTSISLPRSVPESVRLIAFSPSPKDGEAAITSAPVMLVTSGETGPSLENTSWQATGINNGRGGVVSSATTTQVIAMFADGKVSGSAGCNNYSASYEISNSQITIGPAMTTRRQCAEPEGVMAQEQEFLQALAAATQYKLTADRLELRDGNGSLQVTFTSPAALQ
jgi:heat shock protein HslJ